jgi:hypothetical protein
MSYWLMSDTFLSHHKVVRALRKGDSAIRMWLALRAYVALNNTDGFIADEDIDDLPNAPKSPRKWLNVLVECGKPTADGRGSGLIDKTDNGWKIHDYEHHGLSSDEIEAKRQNNRERQKRYRERKSKQSVTKRDSNALITRNTTRDSRVNNRTQPNPTQPNPTNVVVEGDNRGDPDEPFAMYPGWDPGSDFADTFIGTMVPPAKVHLAVPRLVTHFCQDPNDKRTHAQWRKAFSRWMIADWGDPKKREELFAQPKPEESNQAKSERAAKAQAQMLAVRAAKQKKLLEAKA